VRLSIKRASDISGWSLSTKTQPLMTQWDFYVTSQRLNFAQREGRGFHDFFRRVNSEYPGVFPNLAIDFTRCGPKNMILCCEINKHDTINVTFKTFFAHRTFLFLLV